MEITEVRIFMKEGQDKKLKAYATITIDNAFVVRNVKIIDGNKGLFVAMPSRKLKDPCPKCGFRNAMRSRYCNNCGTNLPQIEHKAPVPGDESSHQSEHRDIAHPITAECRDYIQKKVISAYEAEQKAPPAPAPAPASTPAPASHQSPVAEAAPRKPYSAMDDLEGDNDIEL